MKIKLNMQVLTKKKERRNEEKTKVLRSIREEKEEFIEHITGFLKHYMEENWFNLCHKRFLTFPIPYTEDCKEKRFMFGVTVQLLNEKLK